MLQRIQTYLRPRSTRQPPGDPKIATVQDLYYCYRLLLQREPDEQGWSTWRQVVESGGMTVQRLTDNFLNSREFRIKEYSRREPLLVELEDFKIYVRKGDEAVGMEIASRRSYERHVETEMRSRLRTGDVLVDIGANVGYFTLLGASLVGITGKVIAFEPVPDNCELLRMSIRANAFQNIVLYPNAALDEEKELAIQQDGSNSSVVGDAKPGDLVAKSVIPDRVLADERSIDVIKMDIEGSEPRAWNGLRGVIRQHKPVVLTEFNPLALTTISNIAPEAYLTDIRQMGYELYVLHADGRSSSSPQSNEQIMAEFDRPRENTITHIDLLALPRL